MDRYFFPSDLLDLMEIKGKGKKIPYMSYFTDSFLVIMIPPRTATGFEDVTVKEAIQNYSHFMTPKNISRDASLTEEQSKVLSSAIQEKIEAGEEVFQTLAVRNTENAIILHSKGLKGLDAPAYADAFCEKVGAECLCDAVKEDLKLAVSEEDKFVVLLLYSLFQNHYTASICPLVRDYLRNKQKSIVREKESVVEDMPYPISWKHFAQLHGKDAEYQFRRLCRELFCSELPNMREWQSPITDCPGLDTFPFKTWSRRNVSVGMRMEDEELITESVGIVVRYYKDGDVVSEERLREIYHSLEGIRGSYEEGRTILTSIRLYCNLDINPTSTAYQEIEQLLAEQEIKLACEDGNSIIDHIYCLSEINQKILTNCYFSENTDKEKYDAYYRGIIRAFEQQERETIVGSEPLATAYIEPYTESIVRDKVREYKMMDMVESWFSNAEPGVLLLHGQPGDGKTTFCRKVVYEYAKQRRFISADGVFCFTLNDAESHIIDGTDINLERTFHRERTSNQLLTYGDCRGMLIFLDGYDEVKMLLNSTQYSSFDKFYNYVKDKAGEYGIHFVITTRTVAVEEVLESFQDVALQFLPLSYKQQKEWALDEKRRNQSVCVEMIQSGKCSTYGQYWEQYLDEICFEKPTQETSKAFYELLQIPFIFRMVVHQAYDFNGEVRNKAKLYEDLFERTIERRALEGIIGKENQKTKEELLEMYKDLAFSIWCHDDAMTPYDRKERDLLLFSYFMTGKENLKEKEEELIEQNSKRKKRRKTRKNKQAMIGFLHRSIYQYFLALYLYSKLEEVAEDIEQTNSKEKAKALENASEKANTLLAGLGSRLLEKDVLLMIMQIAENKMAEEAVDEEELLVSCKVVFESLVAKEGVFEVSEEIRELETNKLRKRERGNNIFCNAINLCFCVDAVEEFNACEGIGILFEENQKLRLYISGHEDAYINLSNLNLTGVNMEESIFSYVDFSGSDLSGSKLRYADLMGSRFKKCSLWHTDLERCCLQGAQLQNADLSDANLQRADLSSTIASDCNFRRSNLIFANLQGSILCNAAFTDANMFGTTPSANELFDNAENGIPWTKVKGHLESAYDAERYKVGELFPETFGVYQQGDSDKKTPIDWRILEIRGGRALIISDKILDVVPYNNDCVATTWVECSLRQWLQMEFPKKAEFTEEERNRICRTLVEPHENINSDYETNQGEASIDEFWLLSGQELVKYYGDAESKRNYHLNWDRSCAYTTAYAKNAGFLGSDSGWWWLRSVGFSGLSAMCVYHDGDVYTDGRNVYYDDVGVRPALWITLKS